MADGLDEVQDIRALVPPEQRQGDVISPSRAILTLSKSMLNSGCFSLPYAWKLGGLWMSFVLTIFIAGLNWYGNHILVRSSQYLAKKTERTALDYGHFTKKVCDNSHIPFLRNNSKTWMGVVNMTILFYQLGMCSVAILFISKQMTFLLDKSLSGSEHTDMIIAATIAFVFILITNMFTKMKVVSVFAVVSSIFFLIGSSVIMLYTIEQPNQWARLPAYTNFTDTVIMYAMSMYAFEGQTMILPIENKLENPEDFLSMFGVLPTTMILSTVFMIALGFFGYTGFGDKTESTITTNVPRDGFYSTINICLCLQSLLGHSIAMYVVFDMFYNGFQRKFLMRFPNVPKRAIDIGFRFFWVFVTYLMAVLIPRLELMISLVGITAGSLCSTVYPPILEIITFWDEWKVNMSSRERAFRIGFNIFVIFVGILAIIAGLYSNILQIINTLYPVNVHVSL